MRSAALCNLGHFVLVLLTMEVAVVLFSQEKPLTKQLEAAGAPPIQEILDKYLRALGGKAAIEKVKTWSANGTYEIQGGPKGTLQCFGKKPDRHLKILDMPGLGVMRYGVADFIAWSQEGPTTLPREHTGTELAAAKRLTDLYNDIPLPELFPKPIFKEMAKVGERECYVVEASTADGGITTWYLDAQTGLLLRADTVSELKIAAKVKIKTSNYYEDYRDVDGMKRAFLVRTSSPLFIAVVKFSEFAHNTSIDDSRFDKPAPVLPSSPSPEQLSWIRQTAIPLQTVEPSTDSSDLLPLRPMIGDARIVALGEGNHGCAEFFKVKHRLIRFLAEQMGFTIFAIEANMPEAYRINEYVLTGKEDPKTLLKGIYFWTWNTQEVLDMILWMREFNLSGKGRIQFLGFDMQSPTVAAETVRETVKKLDSSYSPEVDQAYDSLMQLFRKGFSLERKLLFSEATSKAGQVYKQLESRRGRYLEIGTLHEVDWMLQNARIVFQALRHLSEGPGFRDSDMAENVEWLLRQAEPGARIVLWADNFHVSKMKSMMGSHLASRWGDNYLALGFAFHEGNYNAMGERGLTSYLAAPSALGNAEWYFHQAQMPRFILDLRKASQASAQSGWLTQPLSLRISGGAAMNRSRSTVLADEFDVMVFLDQTTPSTLLR